MISITVPDPIKPRGPSPNAAGHRPNNKVRPDVASPPAHNIDGVDARRDPGDLLCEKAPPGVISALQQPKPGSSHIAAKLKAAVLDSSLKASGALPLAEVLKMVETRPGDVVRNIAGFELHDPRQRLQVALACAESRSLRASSIRNFYLPDEEMRATLAIKVAEYDDSLPLHLTGLSLTNPKWEVAIAEAMTDASRGGSEPLDPFLSNVERFIHLNEAQRADLFIRCLKHPIYNPEMNTSACIKRFSIASTEQKHKVFFHIGESKYFNTTLLSSFMPIDHHHSVLLAMQVATHRPRYLNEVCEYLQIKDAASIDRITKKVLDAQPAFSRLNFAMSIQSDRQSSLRFIEFHGGDNVAHILSALEGAKHLELEDFESLVPLYAKKSPHDFARNIATFMSHGVAPAILQGALMTYASDCLQQLPFGAATYFSSNPTRSLKQLIDFIKVKYTGLQKSSDVWHGLNLSDPLFKQAKQALTLITNPEAIQKYQEAVLVMRAVADSQLFSAEQRSWMVEHDFVQSIVQIRAPELACPLAAFVPQCIARAGCVQAFDQPPLRDLNMKGPLGPLMRLTLANLSAAGVDILSLAKRIQAGPLRRTLRDDVKMRGLMASLMKMTNYPDLSPTQMSRIIRKLTDPRAISALSIFVGLDDIEPCALDEGGSLTSTLDAYMKAKFSSADSPDDIGGRIAETFGTLRQPDAIWQYMACVEKSVDPMLKSAFKTFFYGVLSESLPSLRYDVERSPHLQALQAAQPGLLEDWRTPLSVPLASNQDDAKRDFNSPAWLLLTIMEDKHLQGWVSPELAAALDPDGKLSAPELLLPQRQEAAKEIAQLCSPLLQHSSVEIQIKHLQALRTYLGAHAPEAEFYHDVSSKIGALQPLKSPGNKVQGIFTDSYRNLFLCGNEVDGSCQRTDGNPGLNRGLLGYIMHGQTAMVAVVDAQSERISSRAILRLLLDEHQHPILFMERPYGNTAHLENVKQVAIAKAKAMGLSLTYLGEGAPCEGTLSALGGPAPYEYCDASTGIMPDGKLQINEASFLYRPN
jgi:hypothetical protein